MSSHKEKRRTNEQPQGKGEPLPSSPTRGEGGEKGKMKGGKEMRKSRRAIRAREKTCIEA